MSKILIIAEKPSVATDLSRALAKTLGKFTKKGKSRDSQHFDNDNATITSAVGHLVELKMPTGPNGKNLPWKFDVLPAIPKKFDLQPIEQTSARLKHILSLARKKEYNLIVNACDAGREGELIFQYIIEIGKIDKPIKRLWMQSMTTSAIQDAWEQLREGLDMQPLANAAKCRSESDWLVGLNSTRALTCFNSRHGGFNITAAGRVQTPTLAILAKREKQIQAFTPTPYAEVHADFNIAAGDYEAKWIDPQFKKDPTNPHARPERIWDLQKAKTILTRCTGKTGTVTQETKPQKQIAPQLYDLTTLQREAPFTAKNTLGLAQALYERHKMLTYPRTDSRYLPEDYLTNVIQTTQDLANSNHPIAQWAADSIKNDRLKFQKRIFNNAKVSDHFAIIPTGRVVKLNEQESKLYDMVVKRFIAVFFPHAEFELTKRLTKITTQTSTNDSPTNATSEGGTAVSPVIDTFETNGKILITPGWLAVYGRQPGVASGKDELCPLTTGENANTTDIRIEEKETNPPARYTESTLLAAMEGAGKLVEDDELREAMSDRGLGTPATRAATIEGLLRQKYLARDARELNVTGKGLRLIDLLTQMEIKPLTSPSMTGDWEAKLRQMEQGKLDRPTFMKEIIAFTDHVVQKARKHHDEIVSRPFPDLKAICPNCQTQDIKQTDSTYECRTPECGFKISKYVAGRALAEKEAKQLLETKLIGPFSGFLSRFNKPFEAAIELKQQFSKTGKPGKWETNFLFEGDEEINPDDLKDDMIIGQFEKDGQEHKIYALEKVYYIPTHKTQKNPDGLKISKRLLAHEMTDAEVIKILTGQKTEKIDDFISNRTKRKFSAFLLYDFEQERPTFEFPPRKKAAKKSPKK